MMIPIVTKLEWPELTSDNDAAVRTTIQRLSGVKRVDTNVGKQVMRIVADRPITGDEIRRVLGTAPSPAKDSMQRLRISGMSCHACELKIEKAWKALPGIKRVTVDAPSGNAKVYCDGTPPPLETLNSAIASYGYNATVREKVITHVPPTAGEDRPTFWQLVALFAVVLVLGAVASRFGLLQRAGGFGSQTTFVASFLVGLVAASSSCIAVSGGLMLSAIAASRARVNTIALFVGGRVLAYGIFGALIGLIGKAFTPSPFVVGLITIVAALYMLVSGLSMLHIAPLWLRRLTPRLMPKALGHGVLARENSTHAFAPALLGAATFFLPCGFTQSLQLYALTTGDPVTSAGLLFFFALGTAPALIALGWASSSLKGQLGTLFHRFAGALVIVLGIWNIQNGFTVAGYPLRLPRLTVAASANASGDAYVKKTAVGQEVDINVSYSGYTPNQFTIQKGVPTELRISGPAAGSGCLAGFQIPKLGIRKLLNPGGITTIAFTPTEKGSYSFSCSMGMFRGEFNVI